MPVHYKPILPSSLIQISKRRLLKIKWLAQFDPKKKYAWINGYNYQNKEEVQILADLVLYPYYPKYNNIIVANSTGVATHKNAEMAINNAALELIERDAFALHWILRKSPNKIMLNSLPKSFEKYICWLKKVASLFVLFDMGNDLLPVLGALAIARGKGMWVSAAADSNPADAMRKILQELIASIATSRHAGLLDSPDSNKKIGRVSDHEMLYRSPRAQKQAFFLTTGKKTTWKKIEENCHPVDNHADYITKSGITLYIVKLNCYNFARMIREPLYSKSIESRSCTFLFWGRINPRCFTSPSGDAKKMGSREIKYLSSSLY